MAKYGTGVLRAAMRQGIDELAQALKSGPEAIQASEPGALWNPLPSEIAEQNRSADRGESYVSKLLNRSTPERDATKSKENDLQRDNDLERD
jgi:hypothetical protein